ncbi:hypothetical protein [Hymenobacter nivis]|uniref:hypothetical protein n=1 Tax=Hymenobacter nivis TaxID=1850093 RepID=UPI001FEA25F6|nr:hypothetical protein [Hymenobacter nivis]
MAFDLEMIRGVYAGMGARIEAARTAVGRPLTLTEKILYAHLYGGSVKQAYERGVSYVDFAPDPRGHAGRYGPNGAAPVHAGRQAHRRRAQHRALRPPDSG